MGAGAAGGVTPNSDLSQPTKPLSAATGAGAGAGAAGAGAGAALTGSGFGSAIGAGMSGSTPLITGSCLLERSWLRRVTVVSA